MKNRLTFAATIALAIAISGLAPGQTGMLPTPKVEEVMVKTTLLTLNDANLTANYDVLFAKMAKPFRDRFTADLLKEAFQSFAGHHIDAIAAMPIVVSRKAEINSRAELMLRGYFDTTPSRLSYQLDFAVSEGEWKPVTIDVKVKGPSTSDAGAVDLLARAAADFTGPGNSGRP
ncbi:MAG: hypothetical protein U1E61_20305 [Bradyrhizobium sp.]